MDRLEDLQHLRALNSLFALFTNSDTELVDSIKASINFTLENATPGGPDEWFLGESAQKILDLYAYHHQDRYGLYHCELRTEEWDPLWIREHLLTGLRQVAGYSIGIVLITGLRRVVCPPGKNWTQARQQKYDEAVSYLEEVAAGFSTPRSRLHLLFL